MNPALGLAAARVVIRGLALAAPDLAARMFRLDPAANPQLSFMTRLVGGREVMLGAATLVARGRTRRSLVLAGMAVDAADVAAAYLAGQEGTLDRGRMASFAVPALAAVVAGGAGLRGPGAG